MGEYKKQYKELFNYIKEEAKKCGFKKVRKSFFGSFSYINPFNEEVIYFNRRKVKKLSKFYNKEMQKKAINFVTKHERGHLLHPNSLCIDHKLFKQLIKFPKRLKENRHILESQANVNAAAKFYNSDYELIDEIASFYTWVVVETEPEVKRQKIKGLKLDSQKIGLAAFNDRFIDRLAEKILDNVERYAKDIDS